MVAKRFAGTDGLGETLPNAIESTDHATDANLYAFRYPHCGAVGCTFLGALEFTIVESYACDHVGQTGQLSPVVLNPHKWNVLQYYPAAILDVTLRKLHRSVPCCRT